MLLEALKSALSKYNTYLASFGEDEFYQKKKVEVELGSLLAHIKQRCSGLGPERGNVTSFLTLHILLPFMSCFMYNFTT